jgi:glycosyltransferase involved in cell wall biosynthesis
LSTSARLSVVVPVYNALPYLALLLDSLIAQDLNDVEFILVDDGSTDASPEVLADYARRDSRIRVVRRDNGGVAQARNTGISAASGKYLMFADADDLIAPDFCSAMLMRIQADNLDLLFCNGRHFKTDPNAPGRTLFQKTKPSGPISGAEWIAYCVAEGEFLHYVWLQACRTELARRFNFTPGVVHEDVIWTCGLLVAAERVGFLNRTLYFYRSNPTSLVNSPEGQARRIEGYFTLVKALIAMAAQPGLRADTSRALLKHAAEEARNVYRLARKLNGLHRRLLIYARAADENFPDLIGATATNTRQRRHALTARMRGTLGRAWSAHFSHKANG